MLFNDSICAYVSKVVVRVRRKGYYRELRPENQPLLLHSNGKVNHYSGDVEEILSSDVTLQDIQEFGKHFFPKNVQVTEPKKLRK